MINQTSRTTTTLATLFGLLSLPLATYAQGTVTCPPAPNLIKVTVSSTVTFDASTNLYSYQYTVANDASSQQEVADFAIDFTPEVSGIGSAQGWTNTTFDGRNTLHWKATAAAPLPPDQPDLGQVPPGLFQVKPGTSLTGFSFTSPHPPGPVSYFALGYTDVPTTASEADAETLAELCLATSTGGFFDLAVAGTTRGPVQFIPVQIDIKPGDTPNAINLGAQGVIPVAILSTGAFDALSVDSSTVGFGPAGAAPSSGGHAEDVNGDGLVDLVFQFPTQSTGIACGDTSATLTGRTLGGGTPIQGSDSIVTVGCKR